MDDGAIIDNPWLSQATRIVSPSKGLVSCETLTAATAVPDNANPLFVVAANGLANGLITASSTASSTSPSAPAVILDWDDLSQATRPSLSRLASSIGSEARIVQSSALNGSSALVLHGLERLAFANASQESVSTEEGGINGTRRSIDQIRRLSLASFASKSKRRAYDSVLNNSLVADPEGREAIIHQVEKTDSLVKIALLYGCTVQAIRGANKLWLNDPIQLRKILYIPLDACTQPPSREVEFIQLAGEDAIHLFMRHVVPATRAQAGPNNFSHANHAADQPLTRRRRSPDYRTPSDHDFLGLNREARTWSPAPHSISSNIQSGHNGSVDSGEKYLPGTNTAYTSDDFQPFVSAKTSETSPWTTPIPSRTATPSSLNTTKKTLAIVRIPDTASTALKSRAHSARQKPLLSVDSAEGIGLSSTEPSGLATPRVIRSSSLKPYLQPDLTPTSSSEAVVPLGLTSQGLRSRPRTPLSGSPIEAAHHDFLTSSYAKSPTTPTASTFPPRTSKISKDAASSGVTGYLYAGTGLLSSLLGGSGGNAGAGWLTADQEEMQLARDYRNKTRPIALPSDSEADTNRRRRSADVRGYLTESQGKKRAHSNLQPAFEF